MFQPVPLLSRCWRPFFRNASQSDINKWLGLFLEAKPFFQQHIIKTIKEYGMEELSYQKKQEIALSHYTGVKPPEPKKEDKILCFYTGFKSTQPMIFYPLHQRLEYRVYVFLSPQISKRKEAELLQSLINLDFYSGKTPDVLRRETGRKYQFFCHTLTTK